MNDLNAKHAEFTHKGFIYGFIRIYAKHIDFEPEICAKNKFYEILLDVFSWIDTRIGQGTSYKLELIEIDEEEPFHLFSTIVWVLIMFFILWITLKFR